MGDYFEEDQREVVRRLVWFWRAGGARFYRLNERAERHGRRMVEVVLRAVKGQGEGLGRCSGSWRTSWWSQNSGRYSRAVGRRAAYCSTVAAVDIERDGDGSFRTKWACLEGS